jgi:hypothetical protein
MKASVWLIALLLAASALSAEPAWSPRRKAVLVDLGLAK